MAVGGAGAGAGDRRADRAHPQLRGVGGHHADVSGGGHLVRLYDGGTASRRGDRRDGAVSCQPQTDARQSLAGAGALCDRRAGGCADRCVRAGVLIF